jgi:hypothetical protein
MTTVIIVKDMSFASKEIDHLLEKIELTKENNELTQTSISQFEMINSLLETSARQQHQAERAVETIDEQTVILQKLVDYLKSIGHWPPKLKPAKPVDPDKWI